MVLLCDGAHPMELLGDVGHVESRFSPFGGIVSDVGHVESRFSPIGGSVR